MISVHHSQVSALCSVALPQSYVTTGTLWKINRKHYYRHSRCEVSIKLTAGIVVRKLMSINNVLKRHRKPIEKPQEGNHLPSELLISSSVLKERTWYSLRETLEENNTGTSAQLISRWLKATDLSDKLKGFQLKRRHYLWASGESYMAMIAGEGVTKRVGTPYHMCWDMSQVYSLVSQLLWLVFSPSLPKPVLHLSSQGWNDSSGLETCTSLLLSWWCSERAASIVNTIAEICLTCLTVL